MATLKKVHITADDRGPIVNIVGWLCIVTTILAILTRLLLRLTTTGRINKDDALVGLGMVSGRL